MCSMMRAALLLTLLGGSSGMRMSITPTTRNEVIPMGGTIRIASSGGSSIGGGTLADKEPVWGDTKAKFVEVPAWMVGVDLVKPGYQVQGGVTLHWDCPNYRSDAKPPMNPDGCMCYIFQYRCSGCAHQDGDLDLILEQQTRNWEKFYCAPKFKFDDGDATTTEAHHPMVAYRTWADSGEKVSVDLKAVTEYVLIGGDDRLQLKTCSNFKNFADCEHKDNLGQCDWDASNDDCINRTCRKQFAGPSIGGPGLGTCAARCVAEDNKHK